MVTFDDEGRLPGRTVRRDRLIALQRRHVCNTTVLLIYYSLELSVSIAKLEWSVAPRPRMPHAYHEETAKNKVKVEVKKKNVSVVGDDGQPKKHSQHLANQWIRCGNLMPYCQGCLRDTTHTASRRIHTQPIAHDQSWWSDTYPPIT